MGAQTLPRMFSVDNAKAAKAEAFGWLNAIHYMAPAGIAGVGNLCPHATDGCKAACLGWYSGHASLVSHGNQHNSVRASRVKKARMFMHDRQAYLSRLAREIARLRDRALINGQRLCVRLNGSTDIGWHHLKVGRSGYSLAELFPGVQFTEYTKNKRWALQWARGEVPENLDLTFSKSETNEKDCLEILAMGGRVAVVFGGERPNTWNGYRVIDGDQNDLRHLDPRGVVVGLSPKGRRAKHDKSGFVVWARQQA